MATATGLRVVPIFRGLIKFPPHLSTSRRCYSARLAEVGVLETPKAQGKYDVGQLFLHRIFGYRGMVLFPWVGHLFDREKMDRSEGGKIDLGGGDKRTPFLLSSTKTEKEQREGKEHTYYQVLVDQRDSKHIRMATDIVTFLSSQETSALYSVPGLDYVSHLDVMPYKTTEKVPIKNDLFEQFLAVNEGKEGEFIPTERLREWQDKNHTYLELTEVHTEITENIRVTVMPFFMGSREVQQTRVYWWRYLIRVQNLGEATVQLVERHWRIFSLSGTLETVRGKGIIGKEPVFSKQMPAFQYTSHVSLQAPSGHMWGTFKMVREDGTEFECRIPPFRLESRVDDSRSPHGYEH